VPAGAIVRILQPVEYKVVVNIVKILPPKEVLNPGTLLKRRFQGFLICGLLGMMFNTGMDLQNNCGCCG